MHAVSKGTQVYIQPQIYSVCDLNDIATELNVLRWLAK